MSIGCVGVSACLHVFICACLCLYDIVSGELPFATHPVHEASP